MFYLCASYFQLLHFSGVTSWDLFFGSQDCQKFLSTSHVLVCASGRSSLSFAEHLYIFHSRSTIRASPSIIFPGLRILRQISIQFVVRLWTMSRKKPRRCSDRGPWVVSHVNQLWSTVISLSSNLIVTVVPVPFLMLLTFHSCAVFPV